MNSTLHRRFQHDLFPVIYADPAHTHKTWSPLGTGRGAVSHYDVMTIEQIKNYRINGIPVAEIADKNAVLYLWVPGPHTPQVEAIMQAWGFKFSGSGFVWIKPTKGLHRLIRDAMAGIPIIKPKNYGPLSWMIGGGYSTRKNVEFCWLGVRGALGCQDHTVRELVVCAPRGQHSEKPDCIRDHIVKMFPRGPRIELFARKTAPGWVADGNQAGLLDNGPVRTRRQPSDLTKSEFAHGRRTTLRSEPMRDAS
jgi:N6-adenosine-specific RNA methylase IME4